MPDTRSAPRPTFTQGDFFLSATNLTATADQRDLEATALSLMDHPVIMDARRQATNRFKILGFHAPAEALQNLEQKMEEWVFHYLILALNADPNYPKVLGHGYGPPHTWFGMTVPGTRGLGTGENVDNHYSFVPIDGSSRFAVHGKIQDPAIADCPFYLTMCLSQAMNIRGLDWRNLHFEEDGSFVITIGPEPAQGRTNHLQTAPDVRFLFIRDGRKDWEQRPNAYFVERLDPPLAPPRDVEELIQMAHRFIIDDVPTNFFFRQMVGVLEPNTFAGPDVSSQWGGMFIQKLARGHITIADDEAYVLDIGAGGSDYSVLVSYDWWLMSGNYWSKTSTFNNSQTAANPDGTYTYVFSIQDPGVHNWVDTLGQHDTLFLHRWQLLPLTTEGIGGQPTAEGRLVKLADLESVLPEGTTWVTPQERQRQLADRQAMFNRRFEI